MSGDYLKALPFIHSFMTDVLDELKAAERCGYRDANSEYIRGYRDSIARCEREMIRRFERGGPLKQEPTP